MHKNRQGNYVSRSVHPPRWRRWLPVISAIVALLVGLGAGYAVGLFRAPAEREEGAWVTCGDAQAQDELCLLSTPAAVPPGTPLPTTMPEDGLYWVGQHVAPGRYYSAGSAPDPSLDVCTWTVFDQLGKFLAGGMSDKEQFIPAEKGQEVPSGVMIQTMGCAPWVKK